MTTPLLPRTVQRVRHPLKRRLAEVLRTRLVTPQLLCVTFGGDDLRDFMSASYDDHVKLMFSSPGQSEPVLPALGPDGMPGDGPRPIMRDYTPRRYDPASGELDIEFVLHGDGPAAAWASAAKPGQRLGIGGPRGSFIVPDDFDWYLLAGDETALPAIARRLAELPAGTEVRVLLEVADAAAQPPLPSRARVDITWLHRDGNPQQLARALAAMARPEGDGYAWAAGEAAEIAALREQLVAAWGLDKSRIRAASYWKSGDTAHHQVIDG